MERSNDVFETLRKVNVNEFVEEKNGLKYLSWSDAWAEVRKRYECEYEVVKQPDGKPYIFDENLGYMVFTTVTIENETKEMWLPVMDGNNKAMKTEPYTYKTRYGEKRVEAASMFDINKTIMRCLVKNLAMFGLGLYIYSGEDLPEVDNAETEKAINHKPGVADAPKAESKKPNLMKLKNRKPIKQLGSAGNELIEDKILDEQLNETLNPTEAKPETLNSLETYYELKRRGQAVGVDVFQNPAQLKWVEARLKTENLKEEDIINGAPITESFIKLLTKMVEKNEEKGGR